MTTVNDWQTCVLLLDTRLPLWYPVVCTSQIYSISIEHNCISSFSLFHLHVFWQDLRFPKKADPKGCSIVLSQEDDGMHCILGALWDETKWDNVEIKVRGYLYIYFTNTSIVVFRQIYSNIRSTHFYVKLSSYRLSNDFDESWTMVNIFHLSWRIHCDIKRAIPSKNLELKYDYREQSLKMNRNNHCCNEYFCQSKKTNNSRGWWPWCRYHFSFTSMLKIMSQFYYDVVKHCQWDNDLFY
jgi:hypothetical protein